MYRENGKYKIRNKNTHLRFEKLEFEKEKTVENLLLSGRNDSVITQYNKKVDLKNQRQEGKNI